MGLFQSLKIPYTYNLMKNNPILIELPEAFCDERGKIQNLNIKNFSDSVLIESKKDSIRANHYHQSDSHYCYLINGQIHYYHRRVGSQGEPEKIVIQPGQMFYTPPLVEHAMYFAKDSLFLAFTSRPRDQKSYEDDIVRVELIKPEELSH